MSEALAVGFNVRSRFRLRVSNSWTWPGVVADGEQAPAGIDRGALDGGVARADHADRGGAAQQRAEQVAARARRVVERDALAGEQQRAVELVVDQRPGAEPLRLGGGRLVGARSRAAAARSRRRPRRATSSALTPARTARSRRCERFAAARALGEERRARSR